MHTDNLGNNDQNLIQPGLESGIVAYNLEEGERPGGLKVRFKIEIATGDEARELDTRQAEAIRRLLQWAQQHRSAPEP